VGGQVLFILPSLRNCPFWQDATFNKKVFFADFSGRYQQGKILSRWKNGLFFRLLCLMLEIKPIFTCFNGCQRVSGGGLSQKILKILRTPRRLVRITPSDAHHEQF